MRTWAVLIVRSKLEFLSVSLVACSAVQELVLDSPLVHADGKWSTNHFSLVNVIFCFFSVRNSVNSAALAAANQVRVITNATLSWVGKALFLGSFIPIPIHWVFLCIS